MKKPRILLAEDHPEMAMALWGLIEEAELGDVVETVADGEALMDAAQRLEPDIIITDISMAGLNGLDATRALQTSVPESKVIILSGHDEPAYVTLAFHAGARGYLLKKLSLGEELRQAFPHVLAGDRYIGLGIREERAFADEAKTLTRFRM